MMNQQLWIYENHIYNIASKFVLSNSIAQVCFMHNRNVSKQIPQEKKFPSGLNVIKQLVHTSAACSSIYETLGKFGEQSRS